MGKNVRLFCFNYDEAPVEGACYFLPFIPVVECKRKTIKETKKEEEEEYIAHDASHFLLLFLPLLLPSPAPLPEE